MIFQWLGCLVSRKPIVACIAFILSSFLIQTTVSAAPKAKKIAFWNDSEELSELSVDNSKWGSLLKKFVITNHSSGVNRIDYAAFTEADRAELGQYIDYMQQLDPRQLTKARQKAYWLNLFNAALVQEVLESEPEDSIREVGRGLWRSNRLYITMQKTSLDDIEHGILRPIFGDPRVHFSLVAGTVGSARILAEPFTGENVEDLLESNTREFLNHERGVLINDQGVVLSSIFKWYVDDFGGDFAGVKQFITPYVSDSVANTLSNSRRARYDYSWALNKP